MAIRIIVFFVMALALVGFGTFAYISTRQAEAENSPPPTLVSALVAARPIRAGALLKPEDIAAKSVPISTAGDEYIEDTPANRTAQLGAMIRRSHGEGEVLHGRDVLHPGDHGFLAAVLGTGMRAITLPLEVVESDASLLWPGDHVDIVLTQTDDRAVAARRTFGRTLMTDVRVIAVDQRLVQGAAADEKDRTVKTLTLEVTQEQVERLAVAKRLGKLVLSTRAADQPLNLGQVADQTVWAGDVSPGLQDVAPPAPVPNVVHVYSGAGDSREFKF